MSTGIYWFRRDLRLRDHPGWSAVTSSYDRVIAAYVIEPSLWEPAHPRRRAALLGHLSRLDRELRTRGGALWVGRGKASELLGELAGHVGAAEIHTIREFTPFARARGAGMATVLHDALYVHPPGTILTAVGEPFRVFTPFHRAWAAAPLRPPAREGAAAILPPPPGWNGLDKTTPDPFDPVEHLTAFLAGPSWPRAGPPQGSGLSASLKWGTLSPVEAVRMARESGDHETFIRNLAWRDFYGHVMAAWPETAHRAMRPAYDSIGWIDDAGDLAAWKQGRTGIPIVDAAMRQLVHTGLLDNRWRMVAASFLVKHLLVDWRIGERFFRHHLLDGDTAQNVGNWQWVAGTGTDAAPYFRVFNPVTQARRFDPDGSYVRRWVPEIDALEAPLVHAPWERPLETAAAGIRLGEQYPYPIIDLAVGRERCLATYARARETFSSSQGTSSASVDT